MARRNTVNFLQIENGLQTALATCDAEADSPWAHKYRGQLVAVADYLVDATRRADQTYLDWRSAMRERLLIAKHLWQRFERIREELGEYGVTAEPTGRIGYFEGDEIETAARILLDFVGGLMKSEPDIVELAEWQAELRGGLETLGQAQRTEAKAQADYRRMAPLRRQAIYRARQAIDEFESIRRDYLR